MSHQLATVRFGFFFCNYHLWLPYVIRPWIACIMQRTDQLHRREVHCFQKYLELVSGTALFLPFMSSQCENICPRTGIDCKPAEGSSETGKSTEYRISCIVLHRKYSSVLQHWHIYCLKICPAASELRNVHFYP